MEVHIQTRKLIKPSIPTPNHLRELKLSCFDQIAPPTYGSFVFFFPADSSISTSSKDERLEKLQNSLSEVLTCFYPLAGRLDQDRNVIDCHDQGAEYLEAQVNANLNQFILEELDSKLLNQLNPFPNELAFTPTVLAVQINKFDCGGLAIGASLSHKFADGFTIFTFVNGWATCCRIGVDRVKCLSFESGSLLPAIYTATDKIPVPDDNSENLITRRFIFREAAISALKAKTVALAGDSPHQSHQPSRVQLLIALIWKARIALAQAKHGSLRNSLLIFPYNFRRKTAIPIPPNAGGNLFRNVTVRFTANESKLELQHLVNLVGNELRHAAESFAKTEQAGDLFLSATSSLRKIHEELIKVNTDICLLTSHCKFPYYEADFGWGKPGWIASTHKPGEMVLLMDTKSDSGIEAWVTLEPSNMRQFEQDHDILAYSCKPAEYYS
ncbi:acetyl-CoA-benzylalcohol acetyltransferase-like [Durio zibethinus]|uniref:Acetyl-CoA-benzylalcohol acetyltransferase-like n=1 Tax=Durio zibethinus TaxID=66656 RepID=A0A6P5XF78_DURZI|nr:acetyl-CoA-benzylalcohol acetyltransferase-like [Durio zibethinus]